MDRRQPSAHRAWPPTSSMAEGPTSALSIVRCCCCCMASGTPLPLLAPLVLKACATATRRAASWTRWGWEQSWRAALVATAARWQPQRWHALQVGHGQVCGARSGSRPLLRPHSRPRTSCCAPAAGLGQHLHHKHLPLRRGFLARSAWTTGLSTNATCPRFSDLTRHAQPTNAPAMSQQAFHSDHAIYLGSSCLAVLVLSLVISIWHAGESSLEKGGREGGECSSAVGLSPAAGGSLRREPASRAPPRNRLRSPQRRHVGIADIARHCRHVGRGGPAGTHHHLHSPRGSAYRRECLSAGGALPGSCTRGQSLGPLRPLRLQRAEPGLARPAARARSSTS